MLTALLALFALANSITDHGLNPLYVKGRIEALSSFPMFQAWNSFSRVAVFDRGQRPPHMWGPARNFEGGQWIVPQRGMNIDGDAGTVAYGIRGDLRRAGFLKYDITNLAHYLPGHRRAAVIGVGGGRNMPAARVFGVPEVTGVEINPVFVRLLTRPDNYADYVGLRDLDGVSFHVDEARRLVRAQQGQLQCHPDEPDRHLGPPPAPAPSRSARTASTRSRPGGSSSTA
jgi:hypothetical protein